MWLLLEPPPHDMPTRSLYVGCNAVTNKFTGCSAGLHQLSALL